MTDRMPRFGFSQGVYSVAKGYFYEQVITQNCRHVRSERWRTEETDIRRCPGTVRLEEVDRHSAERFFTGSRVLGHLELNDGRLSVSVAGARELDVMEAIESIRAQFPLTPEHEDKTVALTFWADSRHGPRPSTRRIDVPAWSDIFLNYADSTRVGLERLVEDFRPAHGGQLLLWQGPPGTGKTYALRALLWEWRKWCSGEYIVDPEVFFGADASYLMSVLLGESDDRDKWRLLIFEDAGELLARDARTRVGQGLSRLLNVVDGLIGQGLRVLVLITTNEELEGLHPAASRPGRAASRVKFAPLSPAEANQWVSDRGVEIAPAPRVVTLAELYAIAEQFERPPAPAPAGFRPPSA